MLKLCYAVLGAVGLATAMKCPTSGSSVHAGCEVQVSFKDSCSSVRNEIVSRIEGQYNAWHDPHNNGTYTMTLNTATEVDASRLTGDKKYTDLMIFTFTDSSTGCSVDACSESQVFSIGDYSTNYCNLHSLYCADAGCRPFTKLTYTETFGKCTSHDDVCLTV
jgi:hypothetical protein